MSRLVRWLDHRMEVVGIEKRKDLAELTGIPLDVFREIRDVGSLEILSRTQRRLLAAALRVSLRNLEQLSDHLVDWIEDDHVCDAEGCGRPLPGRKGDPAYRVPRELPPEDRGTPLIGRIRLGGQAELDEDWHQEWGKHIPHRFGNGHNVFALEIESTCTSVVLRVIAPWEFREGRAAVYCWNGWEAQAWFGRVCLQPKAYVVTADGQRHNLELPNVMRIGKVVGQWPTGPA